jgi:hypothetical protein
VREPVVAESVRAPRWRRLRACRAKEAMAELVVKLSEKIQDTYQPF